MCARLISESLSLSSTGEQKRTVSCRKNIRPAVAGKRGEARGNCLHVQAKWVRPDL